MSSSNQIEDELKEVAPNLSSTTKSHPFTVPEGYFDGLELKLTSISRQNENGAIFLGPKEYPFRVPDEYFNELPSGILSKIRIDEQQNKLIKPAISFPNYLYYYKSWLAAAFVVSILMVSIALFTKKNPALVAHKYIPEESMNELMYAAELDESVVVELYLQNQQVPDESYANEGEDYLRDVTEIQPELIHEL